MVSARPAERAWHAILSILDTWKSAFWSFLRGSNGQVVAGKRLRLGQPYNVRGNLLSFLKGPSLNAPWVIAQAPADFGQLSHLLLIGNSGSGKILGPVKGQFVAFVEDSTSGDGLFGNLVLVPGDFVFGKQ